MMREIEHCRLKALLYQKRAFRLFEHITETPLLDNPEYFSQLGRAEQAADTAHRYWQRVFFLNTGEIDTR